MSCSATFWQLFFVSSTLSNFSSYLLILRCRSSFQCVNWPSSIFHNVSWKKGAKSFPPGADHGSKIKVAGLLGQRFLEKIQNGGRRFTLDWLECLGWRRSFNNFIGSLHFFGFNWLLSYLAKLITPQNCTRMLRNLTFVVQFLYFSIRPKKVFVFSSNCWATFVTTFDSSFF